MILLIPDDYRWENGDGAGLNSDHQGDGYGEDANLYGVDVHGDGDLGNGDGSGIGANCFHEITFEHLVTTTALRVTYGSS